MSLNFLGPHRVPGRELSEFLSACYLCAKANSPSSSQNSPSLPQNSVSSLYRISTLETVFRPFPSFLWKWKNLGLFSNEDLKKARVLNWAMRGLPRRKQPEYRTSEGGAHFGDRDRGGVKTYRTLEGGGTLPESCPRWMLHYLCDTSLTAIEGLLQ